MAQHEGVMSAGSWQTGWFCLTVRDRLVDDGSHMTVDLPELSITVQNFSGVLRGFWNVCAHRGTKMRSAGCGVGVLRCPYHGWVYNAQGIPTGIPDNDLLFRLDRAARKTLALRPVDVECFGRFVFIRVTPGAETLTAALGDCAPFLAGMSGHDVEYREGRLEPAAKTQVGYRNLRLYGDGPVINGEITLPMGDQTPRVDWFTFVAAG